MDSAKAFHKIHKYQKKMLSLYEEIERFDFEVNVADRDEYCHDLYESKRKLRKAEQKFNHWVVEYSRYLKNKTGE